MNSFRRGLNGRRRLCVAVVVVLGVMGIPAVRAAIDGAPADAQSPQAEASAEIGQQINPGPERERVSGPSLALARPKGKGFERGMKSAFPYDCR